MKVNVGYFSNIKFQNQSDREWEIEEEEMAQSFARSLKVIRKYRGYSLKQVSEGTEIPFQTIARYENGENVPSIIQAYKIAHFYDFSVNDMFVLGLFQGIEKHYTQILDNWKKSTNS